jgi:hypothetical protein
VTLQLGARLGPYEILSPLGAGGMGEVYRAHDSKLGRDVAVKVLPSELADHPETLSRFKREAQLLAALNHPNIATIYGIEESGGIRALVMELVEGDDLSELIGRGPLPLAEALPIARQIAEALEAAHEQGIVHRDLKPGNIKVRADGTVKVLDFGLAKAMDPVGSSNADPANSPTLTARATQLGVILGTAAYMSPEQARGKAVDRRADIWAFGVVLYEMLTGTRLFSGEEASDIFAAVLRQEIDLGGLPAETPARIRRLLVRCLDRDAKHRLRDIGEARVAIEEELASPEAERSESAGDAVGGRAPGAAARGVRLPWLVFGGAVAVAGGALLAVAAGQFFSRPPAEAFPIFRQLTRERGTIGAARFVPGTSDALYSARWGSGGSRLYVTRIDQPAPRVVPGFEGLLQSVSSSGEIMGLTDLFLSHASQVGELVSFPVAGGAARTWTDNVWAVSQGEHGEFALVIGVYSQEFRLEWPLGHVVIRTRDPLRSARLHGNMLAYFHEQGENFEDGLLSVVDRNGKTQDLSLLRGFTGMAWASGGKEIWVSTFHDGQSQLVSVDLSGKARTLLTHAGRLELQDVDSRGRALVVVNSYQRQVYARARGGSRDEDLTWLDAQAAVGITGDGKTALLAHLGQWTGSEGRTYLRPLDGSPALDLGETIRNATLSGDGKWVLTYTMEPVFSLKMIPTGPGVPRIVPIPAFAANDLAVFVSADGRHGVIWGRPEGGARSLYSIDLETGTYRQIAPDGAGRFALQDLLSPDGKWIAFEYQGQPGPLEGEHGAAYARSDGTDAAPLHGLRRGEAISGWYQDSSSIVVFDRNVIPAPVDALELRTGRRTPLLKLQPPDPVGISGVQGVKMALDGSAYAYSVVRQLSELYLIEGLK